MKVKTFLSIACLSLMLVGCGNNTVDNSGKSVESTNNKVSKVKHKKTKKDPREVVNGELLKVGQWCNDDEQGKMELYKICVPGTVIDDGPIKCTVKSIKIFKITPQTQEQIEIAKDDYDTNSVPKVYYTLQVVYDLKNTSQDSLQFNGVESIVTSAGQQMSSDGSGMYDDGIGVKVAGNGQRENVAIGMINDGDYSKITDITIKFSGQLSKDNGDYDDYSDQTDAVKISLDNQ